MRWRPSERDLFRPAQTERQRPHDQHRPRYLGEAGGATVHQERAHDEDGRAADGEDGGVAQ